MDSYSCPFFFFHVRRRPRCCCSSFLTFWMIVPDSKSSSQRVLHNLTYHTLSFRIKYALGLFTESALRGVCWFRNAYLALTCVCFVYWFSYLSVATNVVLSLAKSGYLFYTAVQANNCCCYNTKYKPCTCLIIFGLSSSPCPICCTAIYESCITSLDFSSLLSHFRPSFQHFFSSPSFFPPTAKPCKGSQVICAKTLVPGLQSTGEMLLILNSTRYFYDYDL